MASANPIAVKGSGGEAARPVLHLSGTRLRSALDTAIRASERVGGVERFVAALKLKAEVIAERFGDGRAATLARADFEEIVPLMATVRRRVGATIEAQGWERVRAAMAGLLRDAHVPGTADARIAAFEGEIAASSLRSASEPGEDRDEGQPRGTAQASAPRPDPLAAARATGRGEARGSRRFVRDLAAELLHAVHPEHYPLMTRWVWDARTNTGALRELWHDPVAGTATDNIVIDVPDSHETFLVLREEIAQFLTGQGIFADVPWYVDLVLGQVYGDYINAQGGAWLKTDFGAESDPIEQTRRILGVDLRVARRAANGNRQSAIDGAQ